MEKLKKTLLLVMATTMAFFSMTSCLNDNDDNESTTSLSPEETALYLRQMSGTAQGKTIMFYYAKSQQGLDSLAKDSVMNTSISITAADSTARMNFPMKLIAHNIENNEKLKAALEEMDDQTLTARLLPYRTDQNDRLLGFYFLPQDGLSTEVVYADGEKHKLKLSFSSNTIVDGYTFTCIGGYMPSTRALSFYAMPYYLTLDEKSTITLKNSIMLFDGKN